MIDIDLNMEEGESTDVFEQYPTLALVSKFAQMIPQTSWFHKVGAPLNEEGRTAAEDYIFALGFPDVTVSQVLDWDEAMITMETQGWNNPAWEAEEQLMASLTDQALRVVDDKLLEVALTSISSKAADVVTDGVVTAAGRFAIDDDELMRAAVGMAVKCCYQAALVIAADGEEDHPFALKYRAFETGYWPLEITGGTFNIF